LTARSGTDSFRDWQVSVGHFPPRGFAGGRQFCPSTVVLDQSPRQRMKRPRTDDRGGVTCDIVRRVVCGSFFSNEIGAGANDPIGNCFSTPVPALSTTSCSDTAGAKRAMPPPIAIPAATGSPQIKWGRDPGSFVTPVFIVQIVLNAHDAASLWRPRRSRV
jgi:hypothetical protein